MAVAAGTVQTAGLVVLTVAIAREDMSGGSADPVRGLTAALLFLIVAVGVALLTVVVHRASARARTPLLVWNALLIPVAVTLAQSDRQVLAAAVGVTVVAAVAGGIVGLPGDD